MKIKYPSWWYKYLDFSKITDDEVAQYKLETEKAIEENKIIIADNNNKYKQLLELAVELYGKTSLEVKYLNNKRPQQNPAPFSFGISVLEKRQQFLDKINKEKQQKESEARLVNLKADAVLWLKENGKIQDKDFTLDNCIEIADNLAYEIEKERLIKIGGLFDFDGQNCDGPCNGWDGISGRCDCGNRRVSWTTGYGHSFKNPDVRGEAY